MPVHQSPNCGTNRTYVFRPLKAESFRFWVKAPHNVNVCLSGMPGEMPHHMYEIFLGGWEGKKSAIRRNKRDEVCKVDTPNLLSPNEFRGFWVIITKNFIKVGRERASAPIMVHNEPLKNIHVTHYGYCTAYGATGFWKFADDDPMHFEPKFDMSDLLGAIYQVPKPIPPVLGFVPPTSCGNPVRKDKNTTLKWVTCHNGSMCAAPVQVVHGVNQPLVALAYHHGSLIPGVFLPDANTCYISYSGSAIAKTEYFLLSNPEGADLIWQSASHGAIPMGALQGGYSETGEPLYIGRCTLGNTVTSGKVHPSHKVCYVPYWGSENANHNYDVLCLKTVPLSLLGIQ